MNQHSARWFSFLVILALTVAPHHLAGQEAPKPANADPALVKKLIEQLKSGDFKTRDAAAKELLKLDEIPDALREITKTGDLETRRRAEAIIRDMTARLNERAFQALVKDLHKVELDRFVRRMVTDSKFADDRAWKVIETLAKAVTKKANELGGRDYEVPDFDFNSLPIIDPKNKNPFQGGRVLLENPIGNWSGQTNSIVLCSGTLPRVTSVTKSIIIVDGDFTGATGIENCLLIISGKLGRFTSVRNCIILVTGEFGVHEGFGDSNELRGATSCRSTFIQAKNEKIRFTGCDDCVLIKTVPTGGTTNRVLETDRGPLQLVKFSVRKIVPDDQLKWGKEINGLTIAIAPDERRDSFLVRWKNVSKETLEVPWARGDIDFGERNDLSEHVLLKGADGKNLAARQPRFPGLRGGPPQRPRTVVLEPGKAFDETISLSNYVALPATKERYHMAIELDNTGAQIAPQKGARYWTGKIQSNELEITWGK